MTMTDADPRPKPTFGSAQLLEALVADHSDAMARGRLNALATVFPDGVTGPINRSELAAPVAELLSAGREAPRVRVERYRSPVPANLTSDPAKHRPLTAGEAMWLESLPSDPAELEDADVSLLVALRRSMEGPVDKRMVDRRLGPARDFHRAKEAASKLEQEIAAMAVAPDPTKQPWWPEWRERVARAIAAEVPELTEAEAATRADRLAMERWQTVGFDAGLRREELRAQLGELLRSHGIKSDTFPDAHLWGTDRDPGFRVPVAG